MVVMIRSLLLQIRDAQDPMRKQEIRCFANALSVKVDQVKTCSLLVDPPSDLELKSADIVFIGGSGNYSVTSNAAWLDRALDLMQKLHDESKPTFASCWGFQAMSRALGGTVIHDAERGRAGHAQDSPDESRSK